VSAPKYTNLTKVQDTYKCALVVYSVLNKANSQQFWQVLDQMHVLRQVFEQPKKGLPMQYKQNQHLCPLARTYYNNNHSYWMRIWPYAEFAVAE
jgi:hypothetical protein